MIFRFLPLLLFIFLAMQTSAENFYCEGKLGYEVDEKEREINPYQTPYGPPRPRTELSADAEYSRLNFGFSVDDQKIEIHIPGWFLDGIILERTGEFLTTDFYSDFESSQFFVEAFQHKQERNDIGGVMKGSYFSVFFDRVKKTISFSRQSWNVTQDPHVYEFFSITNSECGKIKD